jgi:hypothetical protein
VFYLLLVLHLSFWFSLLFFTRDIIVSAIVWTRAAREPAPLPATRAVHQYFAEEVQPPPIGAPALRAWARSWGVASPDS